MFHISVISLSPLLCLRETACHLEHDGLFLLLHPLSESLLHIVHLGAHLVKSFSEHADGLVLVYYMQLEDLKAVMPVLVPLYQDGLTCRALVLDLLTLG